MAQKMNRVMVVAVALVVAVGSGCGAHTRFVTRPFAPVNGVENGPTSGLWGDTSAGPDGTTLVVSEDGGMPFSSPSTTARSAQLRSLVAVGRSRFAM
jgi:hypothetical protein